MKKFNNKIIYISHDGILEPLGQSQVLEYLEELSFDYNFILITLEKNNNIKNKDVLISTNNKLKSLNIKWIYLTFQNKFIIFKIFNFFRLFLIILKILIKNKISIIHIRSYLPGFYTIPLKIFYRFKLIFDMRGFLPEEKKERLGINKFSFRYLSLKILEIFLLKKSDSIITLTKQSKNLLINKYPFLKYKIFTIPTCVNTNKFKPAIHKNINLTFGYIGTIKGAYEIKIIIKLYSKLIQITDKIKFIFYTGDNFDYLLSIINNEKIPLESFEIKHINRDEISKKISLFDFGIFNLKNNYSIQAKHFLSN